MKMKRMFFLRRGANQEMIKHMVVALILSLEADAGLLQKILLNECSVNLSVFPIVDLDELAEAARIVVMGCLGIPESLKKREKDVVEVTRLIIRRRTVHFLSVRKRIDPHFLVCSHFLGIAPRM